MGRRKKVVQCTLEIQQLVLEGLFFTFYKILKNTFINFLKDRRFKILLRVHF